MNVDLTALWPAIRRGRQRRCPLCAELFSGRGPYCEPCCADLPRIAPACNRCGAPLPTAAGACARCLRRPGPIDRSCIPFAYAYPLDQLIKGLKFHADLTAAHELASLLLPYVLARPRPDCLLPVPLHPSRLRERGYNQALEIARPIAAELALPVDYLSCERLRSTAPQVELDAKARRRNVRRAFAVRAVLAYKHIALVDDVVTTGSTVQELGKTLKRAGVDHVQVWAIARGGLL
ncbi:MAG: ComF family protein [Chromatiales bacterium]